MNGLPSLERIGSIERDEDDDCREDANFEYSISLLSISVSNRRASFRNASHDWVMLPRGADNTVIVDGIFARWNELGDVFADRSYRSFWLEGLRARLKYV